MMVQLPLFLALFWGCLSFDMNESMMKKYAFMKIMSSCLGEDFVMMVKQQMMEACAECHTADMNSTEQHNFDYLMNHFRSSQDSIPVIPQTQMNPLIMYQPFVYPVFMQSPYSSHSLPHFNPQKYSTFPNNAEHFPTQHHDQQPYNTDPHHHASHLPTQHHDQQPYNTDPHHHTSHLPAQNQNPPQYNTFPHHHTAESNAFPHHNIHYQGPPMYQFNAPNIPFEHYSPSFPQYALNNLQNFHDIINELNLNNNIQEHKYDHPNQLNIQEPLSTLNDTQAPLLSNILLRSPIPNNQLGYPQNEHHEKQFFQLHPQPVDPERRRKRSLPLAADDMETLKTTLSSKIGNMTCVFREMGWLTEENDVNFTFIEDQIKNLNLNMKLQEDLIYSHGNCKDFSMCMPTEQAKHPLMREIGGALSYMKCMSMKAVTACMKNDFRMYQAKMGHASSDNGLPMEIDNLLKIQTNDPSQTADDIGSLMFTAAADMIF